MRKKKILIISGGRSNERDVSLKTGEQVLTHLSREEYDVDILVADIANMWMQDSRLVGNNRVDLVFLALHGTDGEDGKVQAFLDLIGMQYTGSGVLASALGMDKQRCATFVSSHGVRTPQTISVNRDTVVHELLSEEIGVEIGYPCVVKPNASGSSIGVAVVTSAKDLTLAIRTALQEDTTVLVQEYVVGREVTCGVLGNTGQEESKVLPIVEIIPHDANFFDYNTKYQSSTTEEICPAMISTAATAEVSRIAVLVHTLLGCDGLTRSDFIIENNGSVCFLEINTAPGQTAMSLCPKEAAAAGIAFSDFLDMQIKLALSKN